MRRGINWYIFWHDLHKFYIWPLCKLWPWISRIAQGCHHSIRQDLEENAFILYFTLFTRFFSTNTVLDAMFHTFWRDVYTLGLKREKNVCLPFPDRTKNLNHCKVGFFLFCFVLFCFSYKLPSKLHNFASQKVYRCSI